MIESVNKSRQLEKTVGTCEHIIACHSIFEGFGSKDKVGWTQMDCPIDRHSRATAPAHGWTLSELKVSAGPCWAMLGHAGPDLSFQFNICARLRSA